MRTLLLLMVAMITFPAVASTQDAKCPNLLIVLSDDQSAAIVGCYGNKDVRTPNLDSSPARASGSTATTSPRRSACRRGPR